MAITYTAGTITVTGYTVGVPCLLADIYAADVAGGWGVLTKQGNLQYRIYGNIVIGDAVTDGHFASEHEQIEWDHSNVWNSNSFKILRNSTVRFGTLVDGVPMHGSCIFSDTLNMWTWEIKENSTLKLYATNIIGKSGTNYTMIRQATTSTIIGREVLLDRITYGFYSSNTGATTGYHLDLENVVVQNCKYFMGCATDLTSLSLNNIAAHKTTLGMYIHSDVADDVVIRNYIQTTSAYLFDARVSVVDFYMINAVVDTWVSRYDSGSVSKTYRQYSFNLKVTDENGVNISDGTKVQIWDKDDLLVVDTSTTGGSIPEQLLTYGYYDRTHVSSSVMKTPHTMRIFGYEYLDINTKFEITAAIDWTLTMYDDPYITKNTTGAAAIGGTCG